MIWPPRTGKVFSSLFAEKRLILALRARFIWIHLDFITERTEIARRKKSQERSAGDLREIGLEAIPATRRRTSRTKGVCFIKV